MLINETSILLYVVKIPKSFITYIYLSLAIDIFLYHYILITRTFLTE